MNTFLFRFRLAVYYRLAADHAHANTVGYDMFRRHAWASDDEITPTGDEMMEMSAYVRRLESAVNHWSARVDSMLPTV